MIAYEKNDKGEVMEKVKPQFTKSFARIICRIQMRVPIPIEKHETLEVMGRFTLRDEGKTIALGKIIKYKPIKVQAQAPAEDSKVTEVKDKTGPSQEALVEGFQPHNIVEKPHEEKKVQKDLVFDLESGELMTKDEMHKHAEEIAEEDEDEDEEESDDDEGT